MRCPMNAKLDVLPLARSRRQDIASINTSTVGTNKHSARRTSSDMTRTASALLYSCLLPSRSEPERLQAGKGIMILGSFTAELQLMARELTSS